MPHMRRKVHAACSDAPPRCATRRITSGVSCARTCMGTPKSHQVAKGHIRFMIITGCHELAETAMQSMQSCMLREPLTELHASARRAMHGCAGMTCLGLQRKVERLLHQGVVLRIGQRCQRLLLLIRLLQLSVTIPNYHTPSTLPLPLDWGIWLPCKSAGIAQKVRGQ